MAERRVDERHSGGGSTNNCDRQGGAEPPKSPDGESSEGLGAQYTPDLKSVLVTSVLNLEELDVDLYR